MSAETRVADRLSRLDFIMLDELGYLHFIEQPLRDRLGVLSVEAPKKRKRIARLRGEAPR